MKTPHTVTFFHGGTQEPVYNPITETTTSWHDTETQLPALVTVLSKERVREMFGESTEEVISIRTLNAIEPFKRVLFKGIEYVPLEEINGNHKTIVHCRRAVH